MPLTNYKLAFKIRYDLLFIKHMKEKRKRNLSKEVSDFVIRETNL